MKGRREQLDGCKIEGRKKIKRVTYAMDLKGPPVLASNVFGKVKRDCCQEGCGLLISDHLTYCRGWSERTGYLWRQTLTSWSRDA